MTTHNGYDRVEINFKNRTVNHLKEIISVEDLKEHCRFFQIEINRHKDYTARLVMVLPDEIALDMLSALEDQFGDFNFRKIEIVRDIETEDERGAIEMMKKTLKETGRTLKHHLYSTDLAEPNNNPSIFSDETQYLGSKNYFQRVSYCRYSKVTGNPCFHQEFRITGANTIEKKTGIKSFKDLLQFHSRLQDNGKSSLEDWFNNENDKFKVISVDFRKLGLWARGLKESDLEPYLDENGKFNRTRQRQEINMQLMGQSILTQAAVGTITGATFTDLKEYLTKERKEAKAVRPYQRNAYQKRLCKLRGFDQFQREI
jgi:hypothetical protein